MLTASLQASTRAATAADGEIAQTTVPAVTLAILTGKQEGVARAAGIFTKNDLINIKLYVKKGLSLPTSQLDVETYIGYRDSGIAGLQPVDIKDLFNQIHNHSFGWDAIEQRSLRQSTDLSIAAERIVSTGDSIIAAIEQMPLLVRVKTKLSELSESQLRDIRYENDDHEIATELGKILSSMKQDILDQKAKTAAVKVLVSDFRIQIAGGTLQNGDTVSGLEPQVRHKYDLMLKNNLATIIQQLEDDISEKNSRIEQLKADYDKYVGLAFTGAAGGIIGLAITGGIFGDKAERARKEKNQLIDEVRLLQDQVSGKKALQKAIENLKADFSDIGTRMVDAEMALNNLEFMWSTMLSQIESSAQQFGKINDAASLLSFVVDFKTVINPWRPVRDLSTDLVQTFNEGLAEYKKLYQSN
jgi:hypothetical protein